MLRNAGNFLLVYLMSEIRHTNVKGHIVPQLNYLAIKKCGYCTVVVC